MKFMLEETAMTLRHSFQHCEPTAPEYPLLLKEIPDPPESLYIKGNASLDSRMIAIVGTRRATPEGKRIAYLFAKELARAGFAVASGLAFGIDTAAHEGCLSAGGRTIAVLPCGIDRIYPASNAGLAERILNHGAILSEYPPQTEPLPYRFLERNRIVSGIAEAVVVVECPEGSGSIATARLAAEQGRDVFVIPGPISHPNFKGSHELIRKGAQLVTSSEDILEAMGLDISTPERETILLREENLDGDERTIVATLSVASQPLDIDKITELSKLQPQAVSRAVAFLIIKGIAAEVSGGYVLS